MSPDNLPENLPSKAEETAPSGPMPGQSVVLETDTIQSIQRTVVAEANAVLASNRKRDPVVTLMPDGTQRIDF